MIRREYLYQKPLINKEIGTIIFFSHSSLPRLFILSLLYHNYFHFLIYFVSSSYKKRRRPFHSRLPTIHFLFKRLLLFFFFSRAIMGTMRQKAMQHEPVVHVEKRECEHDSDQRIGDADPYSRFHAVHAGRQHKRSKAVERRLMLVLGAKTQA